MMATALEVKMLHLPLLLQLAPVQLNRMRQQLSIRSRAPLNEVEESPAMQHRQRPRSKDGSRTASQGASLLERKTVRVRVKREEASLVVPLSETLTPTRVLQVLITGRLACEMSHLLAAAPMASRATANGMHCMIHEV